MSSTQPAQPTCATCEFRVSGYCGNANPRCPNKPSADNTAPAEAPPSKKDPASAKSL